MMNKLPKDKYYMNIAIACSKKSIDPSTQHGCIAVSPVGNILSTGYNGPPRGVYDEEIPLTRPEKYIYMEHAERNCIYNAARIGTPLDGVIFYVTGISCVDCMRGMYQAGASEIVMIKKKCSSTTEDWITFINFISKYIKVRYIDV